MKTDILSNFKFRASSLGLIMTDPRSIDDRWVTPEVAEIQAKKKRTDEEKALLQSLLDKSLSAGAKTYLDGIAKEFCYGYQEFINCKYMDKGKIVEDEAIKLYNRVFFTTYAKNTKRLENEWLTGECDIYDEQPERGSKVVDIKSAWNVATFPATAQAGRDSLYEWQGRAYMMLWNAWLFDLAYCLVSTPPELVTKFEQEDLHYVDHIDEAMRVTVVQYRRSLALEEKIKAKVEAGRHYLNEQVAAINQQHQQLDEAA